MLSLAGESAAARAAGVTITLGLASDRAGGRGRAGCTLFATAAAAVVGGVDYTASKKRCNDVLFRAGSEALRSAGRQTADFAQVAVVELISVMYSHHTELGKGADLRWREIALQGQARYLPLPYVQQCSF